MMDQHIATIRLNYSKKSLTEKDILDNPIDQFRRWFQEAMDAEISEVNAMTLATVSAAGTPDARIVLLKGVEENGFVFFTNYNSRKGKELEANPRAALVFFWKELERQIRITGDVFKISITESEAYFYSRPVGSQIGAIVSPQSDIIANRSVLDNEMKRLTEAVAEGKQVVKPAHWGGYIVKPWQLEFWQGRPNRLHDRLEYQLQQDGSWKIHRLAP